MATRKDSMERKRKLHAGNLHVAFCKLIARNRMAFAFCGMLAWAGAASADAPKYFLYQNVPHNSSGGCALVNAKWWEDESGTRGDDTSPATVPDPTGAYYTKSYTLDTRNETQGNAVPFACDSLHIGEVGGDWARLNIYTSMKSVFKVLGRGLFLHNGFSQINWKPVTIDGNITVDSPSSAAFYIYDRYCDTVLNIPAAMHSAQTGKLRFFANSDASATGDRTFVVKITGDCSDYLGTIEVGKVSNTDGRNTWLYPPDGGLAGSITVKTTGTLAIGGNDVVMGGLSLEDGSTLVTSGGRFEVTNSLTVSGTVDVKVTGSSANVEHPRRAILSVPSGVALSTASFNVIADFGMPCKGVALTVETDEESGRKTLYATFTRNAVYVSPTGDNNDTGEDAEHPFATLAHAVSVMRNGMIYALPGTYDSGLCDTEEGTTHSRIHIPTNVYVKSTAGAASTFIVGASPSEDAATREGATRCVKMDSGAVLQGFSLTGGNVYVHTDDSSSLYAQSTGGAVRGSVGSVVLDCRIYENASMRGNVSVGAYIRCWFGTNTAMKASWATRDVFANSTDTANARTYCFDCLFSCLETSYNYASHYVRLYNCTFPATANASTLATSCKAYNCLFRTSYSIQGEFHNCVFAAAPSGSVVEDCIVTNNLGSALDGEGRLVKGCAAIDAASRDAYLAGWDAAGIDRSLLGKDHFGGQRIYNGEIDAGCSEYDWRDDYTGIVGQRRLTVTSATEDVTAEDDRSSIKLVGDAALQLAWNCDDRRPRLSCDVTVSGTGCLELRMDGTPVSTAFAGKTTLCLPATAPSHVLEFVFKGAGYATVGPFAMESGFLISIR